MTMRLGRGADRAAPRMNSNLTVMRILIYGTPAHLLPTLLHSATGTFRDLHHSSHLPSCSSDTQPGKFGCGFELVVSISETSAKTAEASVGNPDGSTTGVDGGEVERVNT